MTAGRVHLVGGGWGGDPRVWSGFVAEATERAGGTPRGAIDEDTAVVVDATGRRVVGTGNAWWVSPESGSVLVRRQAGES